MASQDTQASKRERQKQRRDAKLAEQRRQAARARRNRFLALAIVAVLALAAVGVLVQRRVVAQRERDATIAAAEARQAELGCTPVGQQDDLGGGHLTEQAQIAGSPPDAIYPDRPASSGLHLGAVVLTGVYDKQIDERLLVHNLEHGYVNVFYDAEADPAQVEALRTFAQGQIDGERPKIVVSQYGEPLQGDANFAYVAWNWRQLCGTYDDAVLTSFLEQHYNGEEAPERFLTPHLTAGSGVLDPAAVEGPLLFPPLAEAPLPEGEATEQPSGSSEVPTGAG